MVLATLAVPAPAAALDELAKAMRGAPVAIVAPEAVYVRGEDRRATVRHHPLAGYETEVYPELFGERAEVLLGGGPTRWEVVLPEVDREFWAEVSTEDPDNDIPVALTVLPALPAEVRYLAVFRYAEFAYDVREVPRWSRDGNVYTLKIVELTLDLQLVIYDAATREPLGTYDAQYPVEVQEIQAKPIRAKAFYKATVGALRKMRKQVASGG